MDLQESWVKGGILITHDIQEGKHQYEVKNIIKSKRGTGHKSFVRKGDKLLQVNGSDVHDVSPEELAQKLAEGNPMLTVHKAIKKNQHIDNSSPAEDVMYPYDKEKMLLNFRMEMMKEEDLGRDEGGVDGTIVEDMCKEENGESEQESDFVIVTMTKTSVSVLAGRSCDTTDPCQECHGVGCNFSDVVMVTESSTVTLVPRGGGTFKKVKVFDASVEHVASHMFLRSLCLQKTVYASPNPEMITIYYYKSDFKKFRGIPVVLNFTGSDCFLKCSKEEERILLQVEVNIKMDL